MRRKLKFRLDLVLSRVVSLSWTLGISSLTIPGKHSMGLVEVLLSVGVFESALHVLKRDFVYSACATCLAVQPFLGAYTSNTDSLSCEDNSREDMTLLKMSIWTNPSHGWPTDQKKAPRENTAKRCGKLLPLQWGDGMCCSQYKLIKFRLTFLRVRFPLSSP